MYYKVDTMTRNLGQSTTWVHPVP